MIVIFDIIKNKIKRKEESSMPIYPRVRDFREDHDKTQKDIADLLHMQLTVYQRYERGERELPLWAAIKLADYYQISLDTLVGRDFPEK